jgi:retron-type reverse transcriptase
MDWIADGYVIKPIRKSLTSGILFQWNTSYPGEGTPQVGVISPLLANIYLNTIDTYWVETHYAERMDAYLIRNADDMLILCIPPHAEQILDNLRGTTWENTPVIEHGQNKDYRSTKGIRFPFISLHKEIRCQKGKGCYNILPLGFCNQALQGES